MNKEFFQGLNITPQDSKEEARKYWGRLGDIPVNEEEEIDEPFDGFEKGTDIYSIWYHVEERFNVSIVKDLMFQN